jgi:hypothetical protein
MVPSKQTCYLSGSFSDVIEMFPLLALVACPKQEQTMTCVYSYATVWRHLIERTYESVIKGSDDGVQHSELLGS